MLEFVNFITLPCGCRFLLAFVERRVRDGRGWRDPEEGKELPFRIVTQEQAEAVLDGKRADPEWRDHVHPKGVAQPEPSLCAKHANLSYSRETYQQVCADNASK